MDLQYLDKLNQAIIVATNAHKTQSRKCTDAPYIVHPYAVASIVMKFSGDIETIQAALLHDVLEDVAPSIYSENDMRRDFGDVVTDTVKDVSEPKTFDDGQVRPWKERKEAYVQHLAAANNDRAYMVSAADKIQNISSVLTDYKKVGEDLWQNFGGTKEEEKWFYRSCFDVTKDHIPADMAELYEACVEKLEEL